MKIDSPQAGGLAGNAAGICVALTVALSTFSVGCGNDPSHPSVAASLSDYRPAEVVGRVDGRRIGAEEARLLAAELEEAPPSQVAASLEERELLVSRALQNGLDDQVVRKRAMVRAFLQDAIEREYTAEDVEEAHVASHSKGARRDLFRPGGFHVGAVRVVPIEYFERDLPYFGGTSGESEELALERANAIRMELSLSPEKIREYDPLTVEPPLSVKVDPDMRVVDPRMPKLPEGWIRAPRVWNGVADIPDNGVTPVIEAGRTKIVAVRWKRIEPSIPSEEEIEAEATKRAVNDVRQAELEKLLEELRSRTATATYPQVVKEDQLQE